MSTILFSTGDLSTIAAVIVNGFPEGDRRLTHLRAIASILALYSGANVAEYHGSYEHRHGVKVAASANAILDGALAVLDSDFYGPENAGSSRREADRGRARYFARFARYNAAPLSKALSEVLAIVENSITIECGAHECHEGNAS